MNESDSQSEQMGAYSNFRNPLGLIIRMLRSGRRSARAALVREGFRVILTPIDVLLSVVERRKLIASASKSQPLILVVGPPRCGTTLVYQVLARYCDVSTFTNLSALFPRSPLTTTQWFGSNEPPCRDIESYYGQTPRLCDPNDGFHVWNRWLGSDRYRSAQQLSASSIDDMNSFFGAWTAAFPKPFLNKNNRNADCISLLADSLDNVYFIIVRRDLISAARSLIRARQEVQGDKHTPWGLLSRRAKDKDDSLGYVNDVCDQLADIESSMAEQLGSVSPHRRIEFSYEDFCDNPRAVLKQIHETVPGLQLRRSLMDAELTEFKRSAGAELSSEEEARLAECLSHKVGL